MTYVIAVFNAGSSSLKFSVFRHDDLKLLHNATIDVPDSDAGHKEALQTALDWLAERKDELKWCAAGHRVVHGKDYDAPMWITPRDAGRSQNADPPCAVAPAA